MATTRTSDPSRAGAVWVTATGSFLLFAAAVTLVAVRWDSIPDGVKLGGLAALSGGLLLAGRREASPIARQAPAAANVLFHLGAFLAPVTAAAVLVHLELPSDQLLLVLGAASAVLLHVLGRMEDSVVLGWGAAASVVVAATGLGGVTPIPATGWLVGLAIAALVAGRGTAAGAWAVTATFGPLVALAGDGGLSPDAQATIRDAVGTDLTPALVGAGAAAVLLALAHRRRALPLAAVAGVALVGGVAVAWQDLDPSSATKVVAAAAAFVVIEVTALLLRRDPFWAKPVDGLGIVAEALALPGVVAVAVTSIFVPVLVADPQLAIAAACGLAAIGWFLADLRRAEGTDDAPALGLVVGGAFVPGTVAASLNAIGVVAFATGSGPVTGGFALALAVGLVVSGRAGSAGLVPVVATCAPVLFFDHPVGMATAAVVAGLLVAYQATLHRRGTADVLAVVAALPALVTGALLTLDVEPVLLLLGGLGLLWAQATILDQARSGHRLGDAPRLYAVAVVAAGVTLAPGQLALVAGTFTVLVTLDVLRRGDPRLAWGWVLGVPLTVGATAAALGLHEAALALPLTLTALPFAAVTLRLGRLRPPVSATALVLAAAGLAFATLDPGVLGTVLVLDGMVVLAAGLLADHPGLVVGGGLVAVLGTWQHLNLHEIESIDLYALPVAALLWLVGTRMADAAAPSWVTHGPAIALAGGTALAERIGGGGGIHALLAGAIGVVAVVEGGGRRLAAPLLLGTGLLVALTAHETTAVTAGVPTWAWLAAGGTLLVGAGLTMEHHELGPVETGRRLVDVIHERFD